MYLSKNDFIKKHNTGTGLVGQLERLARPPKLVEDKDGQNVPSPHMTIKQFVSKLAKGDWAAWTEGKGRRKVTCILFADQKDVSSFRGYFPLVPLPNNKYKPFKIAYGFKISPQAYQKTAIGLGYSIPFSQKIGNRRVAFKA